MILLVHNNEQVVSVKDLNTSKFINNEVSKPFKALVAIAENYENRIIIWCHESQKDNINISKIKSVFTLKNMMVSYATNQYLPYEIGYVEDSPFLKVCKEVKYPTWLMSDQVGAIHSSQVIKFKAIALNNYTFNYALNTIAKLGIVKGLFCYSEPALVKKPKDVTIDNTASLATLFKFVKQNYRARWIILLLVNLLWHDKKLPLFQALKAMFFKRLQNSNASFNIEAIHQNKITKKLTIDVIIPTIGRKNYVLDVLEDLSKQTLLPEKVIIVEQNPNTNSKTELDLILKKHWPFEILHKFIHQAGACNARNLALKEVTSDYVYLADDDNKFDEHLLSKIITTIKQYNLQAITMSYLKVDETETIKQPIQWSTFGAGCSVIKSEYLKHVSFNIALEFGYGEDVDFGMQLRNKGADIIYLPNIKILHLNAPIGGFRTKFVHPWENDKILPKPSPTVLLNRTTNTTMNQLLGYKTILFFKFYKEQNIKNPFKYFKIFRRQWKQSVYWANKLKLDNS